MFKFLKKKDESRKEFPINQNVSFSVALEALKKGYLVKHPNYEDIYFLMINGRLFSLQDRSDGINEEIKEINVFDLMRDSWRVLKNIR